MDENSIKIVILAKHFKDNESCLSIFHFRRLSTPGDIRDDMVPALNRTP